DRKAVEKALKDALEESNTRVNTQMAGELRWLELQLADSTTIQEKNFAVRITASLAAHPGREAFNLADLKMSSNPETDFSVPDKLPQYPDMTPQIADVARVAAANGVTIYALQPDVPLELANPGGASTRPTLTPLQIDPARNTVRPLPPQHSLSDNFFGLILDNTQITMETLTEKTGGKW